MKTNELLKKIKERAERNRLNRQDVRFLKAIAFLKAKGFLDTNLPIAAATGIKLHLEDVIWAGREVEPRILEVLPAAILHYPRNFLGIEDLPEELNQVLKALRNNVKNGPAFEGIPFETMKQWANMKLKDGRTKPVSERKIPKSIRLSAHHLSKLEALVAAGRFKDQTSALEAAIEQLA